MSVFINGVDQFSTANLTDYETGVFTPTLEENYGGDESQTYTFQRGTYTQIGRRVFIDIFVIMNSLGCLTTSSQALIGGLPFAVLASNDAGLHMQNVSNFSITATSTPIGYFDPGNAYIALQQFDLTTGVSTLLVSGVTASGSFKLSGSYNITT